MAKMTADERREAREWSKASAVLGKEGFKAYMSSKMAGIGHDEAMDIGRKADLRSV